MGVIWDSKDAESVKGRGIGGTPVNGARLIQSGGQMLWTPQQNLVLTEDFNKTAAGVSGTANIGEMNWYTSFSGGSVNSDTVLGTYAGLYVGLAQVYTSNVADNGSRLTLSPGTWFPAASFDFRYQCRVRLPQTDANFDVVIGLHSASSLTAGGTPIARGVVIEKVGADTSWYGACYETTRTRTPALVAIGSGWVCFEIRRVSVGVMGFKTAPTFSGLAAAAEFTVNTDIPTFNVDLRFSIATRTTAAKGLEVDFVQLIIPGMSRG